MAGYKEERILIWGKTYPELSTRHTETVCTGGVLEDGRPVRLYPIPYRYLDGEQRFTNYQWITAEIVRDHRDTRPESHRVKENSIVCGDEIPTSKDEWGMRAEYMLKYPGWQFKSVEDLQKAERSDGTSLGIVEPKEIIRISEKKRPEQDRIDFQQKYDDLKIITEGKRAQIDMFDEGFTVPELLQLSYVPSRLEIHWRCRGKDCKTHHTQALDWGIGELLRRKGPDDARRKLEEICDLDTYALKFFMGNFKAHPTAFSVVGLWYPKKGEPRLFS